MVGGVRNEKPKKLSKSCKMKKAITHIKLDLANHRKIAKLNELSVGYQRLVQSYIDYILIMINVM